ncbi:hypothetical protein STEG23_016108 [Scotinomys teguina]
MTTLLVALGFMAFALHPEFCGKKMTLLSSHVALYLLSYSSHILLPLSLTGDCFSPPLILTHLFLFLVPPSRPSPNQLASSSFCCLALDTSSPFPCPAFLVIAKSDTGISKMLGSSGIAGLYFYQKPLQASPEAKYQLLPMSGSCNQNPLHSGLKRVGMQLNNKVFAQHIVDPVFNTQNHKKLTRKP